ncbi:MAG: CDP-alcohol phosphatidyltransferase family protein, partial [Pseudonocardiaceae bacterium]
MPGAGAGIRLLPNAITVLALCSGLSALKFALDGNNAGAIAAIALAALLDGVDGRLARLLDATSRIGAELDSLADTISFGVAPAVVLFIWALDDIRAGWPVALVFTVCAVLRLARFNTLLDDTEVLPFAKEFFVGVPSPSGALLALLPLTAFLQFGSGWWSSPVTVAAWTITVAVAMVSRLPTLSAKSVQVPARAVAPLLVLIAGLAAAVITFPFASLGVAVLLYVAHIPYASYRYRWLAKHPSAWEVPPHQRRVIRRTARSMRRLGLRPPLR